jgi:hypothetical protein
MGQATRTTKLVLDLGKRTQGEPIRASTPIWKRPSGCLLLLVPSTWRFSWRMLKK